MLVFSIITIIVCQFMWPLHDHFRSGVYSRCGFSLIEVLLTVVLTSILSSVRYVMMSGSKTAVIDSKLKSDVVLRVNQIVSLYIADGGSLSGLTTAQEVVSGNTVYVYSGFSAHT